MSATQALEFIENEIENLRKENEALKDEKEKLAKERDKYLLLYTKELMENINFGEEVAQKDKEILKLKKQIEILNQFTKNLKAGDTCKDGKIIIILKGKNNE